MKFNKTHLANELGITRPTLNKKLALTEFDKITKKNYNEVFNLLSESVNMKLPELKKVDIPTFDPTGDLIIDQINEAIDINYNILNKLRYDYSQEIELNKKSLLFNQMQATEKLLITLRNQYTEKVDSTKKEINPFGEL